jgi:hypothetical protein
MKKSIQIFEMVIIKNISKSKKDKLIYCIGKM